jgi:hypothetical protein
METNISLTTLHLGVLPNGTYHTYAQSFNNAVVQSPETVTILGNDLVEYNSQNSLIGQHIDWINKSPDTDLIAAADKRLDSSITGLRAQTAAATRDLDPTKADAAKQLLVVLNNYKKASKKAYDNEIALAQAILNHLNTDCNGYINILGFSGWMFEMQAALDELSALIARRDAHNALKPSGNIREIRISMDKCYHRMTKKINSAAILGTAPSVYTLITGLNPEIDRLNTQYHRAKQDISDCHVEQIDPQEHTGEPVTPVPGVYSGGKEPSKLELGKDYNIAYKNNIQPGNADCIIRGKGKYRGKKTVTFIIVRNDSSKNNEL